MDTSSTEPSSSVTFARAARPEVTIGFLTAAGLAAVAAAAAPGMGSADFFASAGILFVVVFSAFTIYN